MTGKMIRFICILQIALLLGTLFISTVSAIDAPAAVGEVIVGDVNGDGKVNSKDIIQLRKFLANYNFATTEAPFDIGAGADIDSDGKITLLDVIKLREALVNNVNPDDKDSMIGETIDAEYASDFTVAKVFSDNMVVQRNEQIRVWGFAPESENGKKVSATFKGMFAESLIENGEWCVTFGARLMEDTFGAQMKVYTDEKTVTFNDVLVGDVYLVMGQSNAQYQVSSHIAYTDAATQGGGKAAIKENSIIRLNFLNGSGGTYEKKGSAYVYEDLENTKAWTKTTEANTLAFSAIGYYFARHMVEKSNYEVPVGMISVAKGGAPIASFLPNELADKHQTDYYNAENDVYYSNRTSEHMGRYLYNCYLAPIDKYALAGAVWYQGESDNPEKFSMVYGDIFEDFFEHLRSTHNVTNRDFPVFVTELTPIYTKPADYSGTNSWQYMETGVIRSYMGLLASTVNNCYVSSSSDLWNDRTFWNNLHPNCKYEQADRLSDIAQSVIFGNGTLDDAMGPVFKSATLSEDKKTAVITFSNVGDGLTTADGGTAVMGVVGLVNKDFLYNTVTPVSATITAKDQITVIFDTEVKSVAYNYNTSDYYGETVNLCNSAKIPAAAFIIPYEERELTGYKAEDFLALTDSSTGFNNRAIDTLKADGKEIFTTGKVINELSAANNTVSIPKGTVTLIQSSGWAGFGYETLMFGYSIDGGDAIFKSNATVPGQAVINAGGQYAKSYGLNINISTLDVGEHTIKLLALIDLDGGAAVEILSFTLEITAPIVIPDGYDAPAYNASGYGFKGCSIDMFTKDGVNFFDEDEGVSSGLKNADYTVSVMRGTRNLRIVGWIGYETTIDMFGYAVDGVATINSAPGGAEQAVINIAGENAKRFDTYIDISALEIGYHTIDMLVRINTADGSTAVLKIVSFTLIVEKSPIPEGYDAPAYNASEYGLKGRSFDFFAVDGTDITNGKVDAYFTAENYTVKVAKGTKKLNLYGWIGFENDTDMFGYAIDGVATIATPPTVTTNATILSKNGNRLNINVYIDSLSVGYHTIDWLVRINMPDGTQTVLKMLSFTLIIE